MHNPTRVLLCRLGVVVGCLLPTATVGGWIVHRTSSQFAAAQKVEWERELTSRLGLTMTIGDVEYPSPGIARLTDVQWLDPETRSPVAQAGVLTIGELKSGYVVEASQLVVEARQLELVARQLDGRVLRAPLVREGEDAEFSILVLPSEIVIHQNGRYQSLAQFEGRLQATQERVQWTSQFQLPGAAAGAEPLRLNVTRNRGSGLPETVWQMSTASQAWPCAFCSDALPLLQRLGSDCTFTGEFDFTQAAAGFSGEMSGTFADIDLDTLVTERFPHQLGGLARAEIARATFSGGQLTELTGALQSQNGTISHSLLAAAEEHLQVELGGGNASIAPGQLVAYRQLAIGFALSERSLVLSGAADPTQPGVLLANAAGPLLIAPQQHSAPAVGLLRTLLPESGHQVPATRQTSALVNLLPVPDLAPTLTADRAAGHTPTRLVPRASGSAPAIRQPKLR